MVRVLHVINRMNRGGAETFIMNVYRSIDREKIQFDFLLHDEKPGSYDNEILSLGGKIYYVKPRRQGIIENRKNLNEFFRNNNYAVVHAHLSSLSYMEPLIYAKKYGVKVRIIHSHNIQEGGSFINKYLNFINKLFFRRIATDYFACSNLAAKWTFGPKILNDTKYKMIKNGISVSDFKYDIKRRQEMRYKFNIENKIVIGNIARFNYVKNHEFLLRVFKDIVNINEKFMLMLVGDGELRKSIEKTIRTLNLQESVILTGVRSDVKDLLQAMDLFILPSYYEGLPVTLIEAQAAGLKCFVSDNITKEVEVTKNIEYISLENKSIEWANVINDNIHYDRKDESENIKRLGFDIDKVSKELSEVYLN